MQISKKNILIKITLIFSTLLIIGIPINTPKNFFTLIFFISLILFGKVSKNIKYLRIFPIIIIYFLIKAFYPSLNIQEGHNVVLLDKFSNTFYEKNLPEEVYFYFKNNFNKHSLNFKCNKKNLNCWKSFNPDNQSSIYAKSNDWSFGKEKYSRISQHINFDDLTSAKISTVNNVIFNYYNNSLIRDKYPFFVMFEIPKKLVDSSLCWKGDIFWENNINKFNNLFNKNYECKQFTEIDINKKVFLVSFDNNLKVEIKKNYKLNLISIFDYIIVLTVIFLIVHTLIEFKYRNYLFSLLLILSYFSILYFINAQLIYGYDIFPGGMDGMIYYSFGNSIFINFANLNFYEAFKGGEKVFYFPSSLRYFWALNISFFGDSLYGFLLIPFFYTFTLFLILKFLLDVKWAFFITFINFFTNTFDGYALPNMKLINHINVGHAEPLAIFLIFLAIFFSLKIYNSNKGFSLVFLNFLIGFTIFLSISLRPNYFPTGLILIFLHIVFCYIKFKDFRVILFCLLGFSFLLLIPFHNYYYGNSYVFFSSGSGHNTGVPIIIYLNIILDLFSFNINDNIYIVFNQIKRWIKPYEIHYLISFFVLIYLILKNRNYNILLISLMALSQHLVLLIYEPENRYAYLAWSLTIIANIYFIKSYLFFYFSKAFKKKYYNK